MAVGAVLVAAAYLASLAWAGHAAAGQASGLVQLLSDVVHLLAAGAWLGALPGLVFLLEPLAAARGCRTDRSGAFRRWAW